MDTRHPTRLSGSSETAPSYRVVRAVAIREGTDPESLEPPLYSVLDPEALDALIAREPDRDLRLSFTYCGYTVVVDGDGTVTVEE